MSKPVENAFVAYIKAQFFKFIKTQVVKFLIGLGLKMTGPIGWFASLAISKVSDLFWKLLYKLGVRTKNSIEEAIETKKELKDYDEKINAPDATPKDIRDAGRDFITK